MQSNYLCDKCKITDCSDGNLHIISQQKDKQGRCWAYKHRLIVNNTNTCNTCYHYIEKPLEEGNIEVYPIAEVENGQIIKIIDVEV